MNIPLIMFYVWLFLVLLLLFAIWRRSVRQTQTLQNALIEATFKAAEAAQKAAEAAQEATRLLTQLLMNQGK